MNDLKVGELTKEELIEFMKLDDEDKLEDLYSKAYQVKEDNVGKKVYFRGIIEFSNHCEKNCIYCGIRKDNSQVDRYTMAEEEILSRARWVYENEYGSLVLQAGERQDLEYVEFITRVIEKIKKLSGGKLGITLSLGEQSKKTYKKWFKAGAHRYLLRIETSNPNLYNDIHPKDHYFKERLRCLKDLKDIGYQVGTGVMIGLPNQTIEQVVEDLLFFKRESIDMIGMGPYIIHENTPLASKVKTENNLRERNFDWSLKTVSLLRLLMPDINIAATTALQGLDPIGREKALAAGANVLMPIVTPKKYRSNYQLYENKPCIDEKATDCKDCLAGRVRMVGDKIGYGEWGDPPHYFKRMGKRIKNLGSEIDAENAAGQ